MKMTRMRSLLPIVASLLLLVRASSSSARDDDAAPSRQQLLQDDSLTSHPAATYPWVAAATKSNVSVLSDAAFVAKVNRTLAKWHVPGIAISIVDGEEIYEQGYGLASISPEIPVTPHTLFFSASTTKAQVAAALSILIDESRGTLSWTTPISSVLRDDFVLADPWATEHITFEDALSHRTGLPRHDRSYGFPGATPRDVIRGLRHLPMTAEPRTRWQYQNMMYASVGYAIQVLTHAWLGDYLRTKLWAPLGMNETFFALHDAQEHVRRHSNRSQLATPYVWISDREDAANSSSCRTTPGSYHNNSGHFSPEEYADLSALAGAGAVISTVHDYALFLRAMLFPKSPSPISPAGYAALRQQRIPTSGMFMPPGIYIGPELYSFGWGWNAYRGREIFGHSGGIAGFGAQMTYMPPLLPTQGGRSSVGCETNSSSSSGGGGWAVAIMGNTGFTSNIVADILLGHLLDEKLGIPTHERFDWEGYFENGMAERQKNLSVDLETSAKLLYPEFYPLDNGSSSTTATADAAGAGAGAGAGDAHSNNDQNPLLPPLPPTPPKPLPLPLSTYTGTFWNPGYSNMTVSLRPATSCTNFSSHYLHLVPSPRTWNWNADLFPITHHTTHSSGCCAGWFVARFIDPHPPSEFQTHNHTGRYQYGDEGTVGEIRRAKFERVDVPGMVGPRVRMGVELESEMVVLAAGTGAGAGAGGGEGAGEAVKEEGVRREDGMIWFERISEE